MASAGGGSTPPLVRRFHTLAAVAGVLVVMIGGPVTLGWAFQISHLKSVLPGLATMEANTAACLLLAGAALLLHLGGVRRRRKADAARALGALVALVGLMTLGEYVWHLDLGIDQLLFEDAATSPTSFPGRMSPATATNVVLAGLALAMLGAETRKAKLASQLCALAVAVLSLLALIGYLYGAQSLYRFGPYSSMALHTASAFLVLGAGILHVHPEAGVMAVLASESAGGVAARHLLPFAVAAPIALGWLRLKGEAAGFYDTVMGLSLLVFATVVGFCLAVWWNARQIDRAELERRKAEEADRNSQELAAQNRRIQEASRLKSEFLANMSHELRTPLNAIIGFAELMHDGKVGPVGSEHKEYLGDILTSSRHLLQLINDILDLAKVESGKMEFFPEPVNLAKLFGESRDILRTLAARKRIPIEIQVDPAVVDVVLDPAKLKQVLYNYLSNALKFTPDEGRVTIRVGPEGEEALRIEVEDTGIGIRHEDLGRLFAEFQQLDTSLAKKFQGTGLGLALTKRIVEAQGGRVGVTSTLGKGSVFFAVLPRVGPASESVEIARLPRADTPGAPVVLVIEDDTKDRQWLVETLGRAGYAAETARNGAEGLALCRERAFDAVTLDMLLPDMNGQQVLEGIRTSAPNRETPVIVVTMVAEKGVVTGAHVHDILVKPVRKADLLGSLRRAAVGPGGDRPILVVDDDPRELKLAATTLRRLGYRTTCVTDAEGALVAADREPPAAVVLDLLMPGMDGFQFLARFRAMPGGRRTPVIVWTVKDVSREERQRLAAAQAIVVKSEGSAALIQELKNHLALAPVAEGLHDQGASRGGSQ